MPKRRYLSKDQQAQRRAEMATLRAQGLSNREIGERYGLGIERVRQLLRGVPIPDDPSKDQLAQRSAEIAELRAQGKSRREIRQMYGLSKAQVRRILLRLGVGLASSQKRWLGGIGFWGSPNVY